MSRLAPAAILLLASTAFAFDKPKAYFPHVTPKVSPANADVYDLLLFDKARPYWIRFHVRFDGKPYSEIWSRAIDALFADLDRNGDGSLDPAECKRVPHRTIVIQAMQSGYPYYAQWPSPDFRELDADKNGRVSRAELEAYYLRTLVPSIPLVRTVQSVNPDPYSEIITKELFDLLDRNKDGKITPDEARKAEEWLNQYDLDEDECLTALELVPNLLTVASGQARTTNLAAPQMIFARLDAPGGGLTDQFLRRYDIDQDYHLSRTEIGLDDEAFAALDRDGNGKLDVPELADFFSNGLPDVELRLDFDKSASAATLARVVAKRRPAVIRAAGVYQILVKLGPFQLTLGEPPNVAAASLDAIRENYKRNFTQLFAQAAEGKSYVDAADLQKPNYRTLLPFLVPADRNGDGRLTLAELTSHLDMLFLFADAPLGLTMLNSAPNWFNEMDTNRDGRLSRMELRNVWKSLTAAQPSATEITLPDTAGMLHPVLHRGPQAPVNYTQNYFNTVCTPVPTRGPLWFRKMDRNGDGYVSRREFLGTKADFDRIDRNGDGLIDPDEAEAASK